MNLKIKRMITFLLALALVMTSIPSNTYIAYGDYDPDLYRVESVTLGKTFDSNRNLESAYILIRGRNLRDIPVGVITATGGFRALTNRMTNTSSIVQFDVSQHIIGETLVVGDIDIHIGEDEIPELTGITRKITEGKNDLTLQGTRLKNVQQSESIKAFYGPEGGYSEIPSDQFIDDTIVRVAASHITGQLGLQNILFTKTFTERIDFNDNNQDIPVKVEVIHAYQDQFRLVQELNIADLEMFPNRGVAGDTIFFRGESLDAYDVFFLQRIDGTEAYTNANRGVNKTFLSNADGNQDLLTVQVPNIPPGDYYIVLTNPISGDPSEGVNREMIVRVDNSNPQSPHETFTVISSSNRMRITRAQPNRGPESGARTTLDGRFIGTLNIERLTLESQEPPTVTISGGDRQRLIINYGPATYRGTAIDEVIREVNVIIGNEATFVEDGWSFSDLLDQLEVVASASLDPDEDPVKDIVIEARTTLKTSEREDYVFTERDVFERGYTFIPSTLAPNITSVTPDKIQVIPYNGDYQIPGERLVAIHGSNFLIHRFQRDGQTVVRYPVVRLGNIELDKNEQNITLYVLDNEGNILDGTQGNEVGTKIIVHIPAGETVLSNHIGRSSVEVINPIRNSTARGLSHVTHNMIEFVQVADDRIPVITSVTPDVVAVEGGETVVVQGSNFQTNVRVFIDGEAVQNINRSGDGRTITFNAPPGREGETQLQVMNSEGGMATWPFRYVQTHTDPRLFDFSPKSGNTGTLIMITGDNFLKPDAAAGENEIERLIGTRVLLGNRDVNTYNRDGQNRIQLLDYDAAEADVDVPEDHFILQRGQRADGSPYAKTADYYHSVLLYDEATANYYTLDRNVRGVPILTDGFNRTYEIEWTNNQFIARGSGGASFQVEVNSQGLVIKGAGPSPEQPHITLKMQTPYRIEDGVIVGNRVQVIDKGQIFITVPILEADGYYDVTVVNPDTKSDSRRGNQGFYYYGQPQSRPQITRVVPAEGSTAGGYTIDIEGSDFKDDGQKKSQVFINGVEVPRADIEVSTDGRRLTAKVPAYPGDLFQDRGTRRLTVPVVVINPDGASASRVEGFTYIVPTSYPEITRILPARGNAAGGEIIEIYGRDFRFFEPYEDDNRDQQWNPGEYFQDLNGNGSWDDFTGRTVEELEDLIRQDLIANWNGDFTVEELEAAVQERYHQEVTPVLPKVFFGNRQAQVVEFGDGFLKVKTPVGTQGNTEVYVLNNDAGTSNKVQFTYESSNPRVNTIVPNVGGNSGGDRIEIWGEGFMEGNLQIYEGDSLRAETMPLVQFGNISNHQIPREVENGGRVDNQRATVNLAGGLRVEYNAASATQTLRVTITENGASYSRSFPYTEGQVFIPVSLLRNGEEAYLGKEMIRVSVEDRRLLVDRGYAPKADRANERQLSVYTPSYHTVGRVPVTIQNPDGGRASGEFQYKNPDSQPIITNMTREGRSPEEENMIGYGDIQVLKLTYKGGNRVSIIGSDFREDATIQISNLMTIQPNNISYQLPNRMTFTMPAVSEEEVGKLHRAVVINEDGGSAASDEVSPRPIYIMFIKGETEPTIESITPNRGPARGGTRVRIEGRDFREGLSVYFGEEAVPQSDITLVDYRTVYVTTPGNVPGPQEVKVENPDGELSRPNGEFTYISNPRVTAVIDPADPTETQRVHHISVEGGQEIKLKGTSFMEGARVIFNPTVRAVTDEGQGNLIYIEGQPYQLESGNQGADFRWIDEETVTVKAPQGQLNTRGVMIINPDGGASDIYGDIEYTLPQLVPPTGVVAELVYDRYIRVHWNPVQGATSYEIYVMTEDNQRDFIGSTRETSSVFHEIEPRTSYWFIVRAVGDFGSSNPSMESNTVRTGRNVGTPDDDGAINERTQMQKTGNTAHVTIGTADYDDRSIVIDLTRGDLAGSKEVVISMPAEVIMSRRAQNIEVLGLDYRLLFNPNVFQSNRIRDHESQSDAGVRFKISPHSGALNLQGQVDLSSAYHLEGSIFIGNQQTSIDRLAGNMTFQMNHDRQKAQMRRLERVELHHYDHHSGAWRTVTPNQVDRLGQYLMIGNRR